MKHLSNVYNPEARDAKNHVLRCTGETLEEAWQHHLEWLRGKRIGLPAATEKYTVEQLINMNIVGVYSID